MHSSNLTPGPGHPQAPLSSPWRALPLPLLGLAATLSFIKISQVKLTAPCILLMFSHPETFLEVPLESLSDFLDAPCRLGLGQSAPLACVHSGERFVHWLLLWFPCHTRTHSQLEEWNLMMQDDPKAVSIFFLSLNLLPQSSPSLVGQKDQPRSSLTKGALGSLASGGTTRYPHPGWHQVFTHQTFVT